MLNVICEVGIAPKTMYGPPDILRQVMQWHALRKLGRDVEVYMMALHWHDPLSRIRPEVDVLSVIITSGAETQKDQ